MHEQQGWWDKSDGTGSDETREIAAEGDSGESIKIYFYFNKNALKKHCTTEHKLRTRAPLQVFDE
jgi:hypothetical protein